MKTFTFVCALWILASSVRATEPSRFGKVDDSSVIGRFIDVDLDTKERSRLYFVYERNKDSGAELELTVGGKTIWQQYVEGPASGASSVYSQKVEVRMGEDDKTAFDVFIYGWWTIYEKHDLKTGKLLERKKL